MRGLKLPTNRTWEIGSAAQTCSLLCCCFCSAAATGDHDVTVVPCRRTQPWLLHDGAGTVTHRGHLEGGLGSASASAGYFVLIKEGSAFTALPAEQFYTFRPKQK